MRATEALFKNFRGALISAELCDDTNTTGDGSQLINHVFYEVRGLRYAGGFFLVGREDFPGVPKVFLSMPEGNMLEGFSQCAGRFFGDECF